MTINEAKQQIFNAITAYRTRDEYDSPLIPQNQQRPVFLLGAPGIGKTAIMAQIAHELDIPLVSYSMTHHTRQSALGLPYIRKKVFDGEEYRVSEYTMSEIIAEVYKTMEETGKTEGILFLDEINCVSETLAPAMLQFLQYKVFGQHKVPEGWIVVTAGNPPEFNNSVREFDMVTWDRLKRIDVEPDFTAWRKWAVNHGVHAAVLSYLEANQNAFYKVESTVDGKRFVTPRGWVDLSDMIKLYEQHKIKVDNQLVAQYLQDAQISLRFANYYDLWLKYRVDYQINDILAGKVSRKVVENAGRADFDERISLVGLIMDAILVEIGRDMSGYAVQEAIRPVIMNIRKNNAYSKKPVAELLNNELDTLTKKLKRDLAADMLARDTERIQRAVIAFLQNCQAQITTGMSDLSAYDLIKKAFDDRTTNLRKSLVETKGHLENVFKFAESAFSGDRELLIIVTELTASGAAARFIASVGCDGYFRHNKSLLIHERQIRVISEIDQIEEMLQLEELGGSADQN